MPAHAYWIDQPLILSNDYIGKITSQDAEAMVNSVQEAVRQGPTYIIVDLRQATSLPTNLIKIGSLTELVNNPNLRWLAIVGPNAVAKFLINLLARNRAVVFGSREEAEAFLRQKAHEDNISKSA